MSWDLFTAAAALARESEQRNAALARTVAAREIERGPLARTRRDEPWTVAQVNAAARELVEGAFPPLWVAGEITNFTRARSGHCYFSLRDRDAQIRCVMWRDEARRLPTMPSEGMEVRALGRLTLYEARGEFQLSVSDLEAKGDGLWKLAFEQVFARLRAEGLTDAARKRPLPPHPTCVGVVTSPAGAVLHDVVSVIRRRAPWTRIVLCGCRVQGEGAAAEIAAALDRFARAGCADVLIVGRGGGSVEDLWAFNEEIVARAIAASPVPVISAVGHETDFTIADLVADHRAPTPSAAAEAAVPDGSRLRAELSGQALRLRDAVHGCVAEARRDAAGRAGALHDAQRRIVTAHGQRLHTLASRLHALSPLSALARGYALPLDEHGRTLRRRADFPAGRAFRLRLADGEVPCRAEPADAPPR